jgi:hypothetical protein
MGHVMHAVLRTIVVVSALYATRQEDVMLVAEQVFVADVMGLDGFGFVKFASDSNLFA